MGRPYKCPYCGESGKSTSKGVRKTKTLGDRMIRFCKACRRKFTPRNQKPGLGPEETDALSQSPAGPAAEPAGTDIAPTATAKDAAASTVAGPAQQPGTSNEQHV